MLKTTQIADKLTTKFGDQIIEAFGEDKHPRIDVDAAHWREIASFLLTDPELKFDFLMSVTAIDYVGQDKLAAVYDLRSFDHGHEFAVKVFCDRANPEMESVADLWPAANWHEREAFDLMGIVFTNHPDLRRILMSEDWVGHPLQKDYEFPKEYHGIPNTYELNWQQKPTYPG